MPPKVRNPRKILIAAAVAGVGALGVGVAGAVGGIPISPGPSDSAGSHPAPEATTVSLPDAASAGSGNASAAADVQAPPPDPGANAATPEAGVAPSESELSTALDATEGTPGNTVLNDLINTAPGPDRGATISDDAKGFAASQAPDLPEQANSHRP
jgi:hypothetical protein